MSFKYIILIITLLFLILAVFGSFPYGFYTLLRFVVTIFCGYVAYLLYKVFEGKNYLYVLYGFLAILFNPVIPIHLDREIWQVIDVIMIVFAILPYLFKSFRDKDVI